MRAMSWMLVAAVTLVGSACASRPADLLAALGRSSVRDIVVEVPPGIGEGLLNVDINGVADKDKAPAVAAAVKQALTGRVMGFPGGPEGARLRVTLSGLSVASSAGRVIGSSSSLRGQVRLENLQTGQLIASLGEIVGEDKAVQGGGNVGAIVALAVNAASAASEDRIGTLSAAFSDNVKKALTP